MNGLYATSFRLSRVREGANEGREIGVAAEAAEAAARFVQAGCESA